jgi:hypothetical protein
MAWYTSRREDQQDTIYIFFSDEENVAKKTVRKSVFVVFSDIKLSSLIHLRIRFIGDMEEKRFRRGIFVYRRKMTPAAKKVSRAFTLLPVVLSDGTLPIRSSKKCRASTPWRITQRPI